MGRAASGAAVSAGELAGAGMSGGGAIAVGNDQMGVGEGCICLSEVDP